MLSIVRILCFTLVMSLSVNAFVIRYVERTPVCNGESFTYPHEKSCRKYYECEEGRQEPIPRECATGLHYSYDLETCVLPDFANCNVSKSKYCSVPKTNCQLLQWFCEYKCLA